MTHDLDDDHPLWGVNEQIKGLLEGMGADEDHEDVLDFLHKTGLPDGTTARMHRAIVCAEWQPIETAPRDGTVVLLGSKSKFADGYWLAKAYNGNGAWIWPYIHMNPTRWMPLPDAPNEQPGERNARTD